MHTLVGVVHKWLSSVAYDFQSEITIKRHIYFSERSFSFILLATHQFHVYLDSLGLIKTYISTKRQATYLANIQFTNLAYHSSHRCIRYVII